MNAEIPTLPPPTSIFYTEKHVRFTYIKCITIVLYHSIFNSEPTCTRLGLWLVLITPVSPTLLPGLLSGSIAAQHRSDKNGLCVVKYLKYSWKVIDETLSPTWDELIIFGKMLVHGRKEDIKENPPMVIIEFYDQDKVWLFLYYCFNIQILFSSTRQSSSDELLPSLMYFWRKIWYFSKNSTIKENVVI